MIIGWLATALAGDTSCDVISMKDVLATPAPAVLVLGERAGTEPDLRRATAIARRLGAEQPVTVALEAVHERYQPDLDAFAHGGVEPESLPVQLDWTHSWGFPYRPYERLVTGAVRGQSVVAAGTDLGDAPVGALFPVPQSYMRILSDITAGSDVPPEHERSFVRAMAWRDHEIAANALAGWDGKGYLVIVTGRGHVEGGKGVAWQVQQARPDVKVDSFVLAWGGNPPCYDGDKVWRFDPFFG